MKKLIAMILTISMFVQISVVVNVSAASTSAYDLAIVENMSIKNSTDTVMTNTKSLAITKIGQKTFVYVGKENSGEGAGGLYIYEVTDNGLTLIDYLTQINNPGGSTVLTSYQTSGKLDIMTYNGDKYLLTTRADGNTGDAVAVKLNNDGTLNQSSSKKIEYLGHYYRTIRVIDNYVLVYGDSFEATPGIEIKKFDGTNYTLVSKILHSVTGLSSQNMYRFDAKIVGNYMYVALIIGEQPNGESAFKNYVEIYRGDLTASSVVFERLHREEAKVDDVTFHSEIYGASFVDNQTVLFSNYDTGNDGGSNGNSTLKVKFTDSTIDLSVAAPTWRGRSVLGITDQYAIIGNQFEGAGKISLYDNVEEEIIRTLDYTDAVMDIECLDDDIYVLGLYGHLAKLSYKTSVTITNKPTETFIQPEYAINADITGMVSTDQINLYVDNTAPIDVTSSVNNNILTHNIPLTDGEHTIKVALKRGDEEIVYDETTFTSQVKPQIEITGTTLDNLTIRNLYSTSLANGTVVAISYDNASMLAKGKLDLTNFSGELTSQSIILDATAGENTVVFAIKSLEEPELISNVVNISGGNSSFAKTPDTTSISAILNKPNALQSINPQTNVFSTTAVNHESKKCDAVMLVFNDSVRDWANLSFAYVGETDDNGYVAVDFTINDNPSEGDIYYSTIAMGKNNQWTQNDTLTKSYWGIGTVNSAVQQLNDATAENIYTVLTDAVNYDVAKVFILDFTGDYITIGTTGQTNVLKKMVDTLFTDSNVETTFISLVQEQMIVKSVNDATGGENGTIFSTLSTNSAYLGIDLTSTGLYSVLSSAQKLSVLDSLTGQGFNYKDDVKTRFINKVKMEFINGVSYSYIVENDIIENYYDDFGISQTYKDSYVNSNNKINIIRTFLSNTITDAGQIPSLFELAVDNPASFNTQQNQNQGGGGGGGSYNFGGSFLPNENDSIDKDQIDTTQEPVDPDDEIYFKDVNKSNWYYEAVYGLAKENYVNGVSKNEFAPNSMIKREEFVKMIIEAFGLLSNEAECDFNDVSDLKWYYRYIASAQAAKVVNGDENGNFGVGEYITREDMAVIIFRALTQKRGFVANSSLDNSFADKASISGYAVEAVNNLSDKGYINGFEDNTFDPKGLATRAQASQIIWNIVK